MHPIPKLTAQRLAELPPGTPIRIGSQLVTFNGCSIRPNYKGVEETFVDYTLPDGTPGSHFEYTVLDAGTEHLESVRCRYCGRFRHPEDVVKGTVKHWNRSERDDFCADRDCALRYQQSIRVPSHKRAAGLRIRGNR
ncbi:hypothetical protein [Erwinia sp. JUb26]|uniref:hypothetical protein n=1 Tax=Erwinia sp. JUb26 TaxID=2485126 RepID=UPI000F47555D|nr:hypothetical protein [Erwinia sp. JUb26]ROR14952.1 hypothetical protein EC836_101452 [Erwinia sp. JUb26]